MFDRGGFRHQPNVKCQIFFPYRERILAMVSPQTCCQADTWDWGSSCQGSQHFAWKGHFGRKWLKILLSVANCRSLFFAKIYFLLIQFLLPTKCFALVPIEVGLELVVSPCGAVVEEALALGRGATRLPGAQGQQGVRGGCGGSEAVRPCKWEILFQRNC